MKQKLRPESIARKARLSGALPDLEHTKAAVLNSLTVPTPSATSSLTGIALSLSTPSVCYDGCVKAPNPP